MGCCYSTVDDDEDDPLLRERDAGARRKAADAALRRVGNFAKTLRPGQRGAGRPSNRGGSSAFSDGGMRWSAG